MAWGISSRENSKPGPSSVEVRLGWTWPHCWALIELDGCESSFGRGRILQHSVSGRNLYLSATLMVRSVDAPENSSFYSLVLMELVCEHFLFLSSRVAESFRC